MAKKKNADKDKDTATKAGAKKAASKKGPKQVEPLVKEDKKVITVDMELTDQEMVALSKQLIGKMNIIEGYKDELKQITTSFKGKISDVQKEIDEISAKLDTGKKKESVICVLVRDFNRTVVMFVKPEADLENLQPGDVFKEEPFSEHDYQRKLALEETGNPDGHDEDNGMFNGMNELNTEDHTQTQEEEEEK